MPRLPASRGYLPGVLPLLALLLAYLGGASAATNPSDVAVLQSLQEQAVTSGRSLGWNFAVDPCGAPNCCWASRQSEPLCTFQQLCCSAYNVTGLNLSKAGIKGALPPHLDTLSSLQVLGLQGNGFTGTLPPWTGWPKLAFLDVSHNALTGTLPAAWAANTALQLIMLGTNSLSGPLPAAWSALTGLMELDLSSLAVAGALPSSWAAMMSIEYLDISGDCQVCGTAPFKVSMTIAIGGSSYGTPCDQVNCHSGFGVQMYIVKAIVAAVGAVLATILLQQLFVRLRPRVSGWLYGPQARANAEAALAASRRPMSSRAAAAGDGRRTAGVELADAGGGGGGGPAFMPPPISSFPKDSVIVVQPDGHLMCLGHKTYGGDEEEEGGAGKGGLVSGGTSGSGSGSGICSTVEGAGRWGDGGKGAAEDVAAAGVDHITVSIETVYRPRRHRRSTPSLPSPAPASPLSLGAAGGGAGSAAAADGAPEPPLSPRGGGRLSDAGSPQRNSGSGVALLGGPAAARPTPGCERWGSLLGGSGGCPGV